MWRCSHTMKICVAEYGGFCFGVKRAVDTVLACAEEQKPGRVFTWGPIIHNEQVLSMLRERGVEPTEDASRADAGDRVIIRSHGTVPKVFDELAARGCIVVDATCPYVSRIHRIVREAHEEGRDVFIVGTRDHPEVVGINGWAGGNAVILGDAKEAEALGHYARGCVVAQTTTTLERWQSTLSSLKGHVDDLSVRCSICNTTEKRQSEALDLAEKCDAVVVIGGRSSANTQHLYEVCRTVLNRCYKIETSDQVTRQMLEGVNTIGVIAGASTPECIIEEVITSMSELENTTRQEELSSENAQQVAAEPTVEAENKVAETAEIPNVEEAPAAAEADETSEASFAEEFEKTLVRIRNGQIIKGVVVHVNENEVCVNIGYKSDGFVSRSEFSADGSVNPADVLKVGDEIEVEVVKVNDGEGNVVLSKKNVDAKKNWRNIIDAYEEGRLITATVKEVVKGGLVADADGIRAFIPASHLAMRYVENMESYVGQELELKIIELDRAKRRVVASRKEVLKAEAEEAKKHVWEQLEVGMRIKGTVQRLTNFGAFVDIGGVDGLIHINDLSWGRVKHPSDVVKPGDEVEVVVLSLDREKERISLGYKQTQAHPWETAVEKYPAGAVVEGRVVRIVTFGAFVELEPGLDGLVHISNIANRRLEKVEDALKVGDVVNVKVLEVNPENKRISLSIKATLPREEGAEEEEYQPRRERREQREPRERFDRQNRGGERRERRERPARSNEPTSYSEESGVTIGDLMPAELRAMFQDKTED